MPKIRIINYGVGNLYSAFKGCKRFADDVLLTEDAEELRRADALVLPGQGAFEAGMEGLRVRGLLNIVKDFAAAGKPVLGICLGAQILLSKGYEFGEWEGLGIIPGDVVHFPELKPGTVIPHMGWNSLEEARPGAWKKTALEGIPSESEMYFIHSYILRPSTPSDILAETEYGGCRFASVIGRGNVIGCQFHPEKSGPVGLRIVENFVNRIGK